LSVLNDTKKVAEKLGVSLPSAYRIIRQTNVQPAFESKSRGATVRFYSDETVAFLRKWLKANPRKPGRPRLYPSK